MAWQQQGTSAFVCGHSDPQTSTGMSVNAQGPMSIDMIRWAAEQAASHAARQPYNQAAYAEALAWQQRLQAALASPPPSAPMPPGQQGSQLFVPSNLPGAPAPVAAPAAPTPPGASFKIPRS